MVVVLVRKSGAELVTTGLVGTTLLELEVSLG